MSLPFFVRPGFGELPVGSVTAFAGTLGAPDSAGAATTVTPQDYVTDPIEAWGWMFCDGRSLPTYDYPELFAVLGYVYGGSGKQFLIPDYRGYFLRGIGTGTTIDPDISTRNAANGQGQGSGVGSTQSFAMQTHAHDYNSAPAPATPSSSGTAAGASSSTSTPTTPPVSGQGQSPAVQVSQHETRPINVYVNHIIKFTYGLKQFAR